MNRTAARGLALAAGLVAGLLGGCASARPPAGTAAADAPAGGPAAVPAARYADVPADRIAVEVFRADRLAGLERAHQRLRAECMSAHGFPQLAAAGLADPTTPFATLNVTPPEFAAQGEADARRHGFGRDEPGQPAHVMSNDADFDRAFDRCTKAAAGQLGWDYPRVSGQMYELMNAVSVESARLSATGATGRRFDAIARPLLDCLDRRHFRPVDTRQPRTLDAYGVGRPGGHLAGPEPAGPKRVPGTVETLPPVPPRAYVPPPGEVALAVAAAHCARATGYAEKYVAERLAVVRQVLAANAERLAALGHRLDQLAANA